MFLGGGVPGWWCSWVVVFLGGGVPGWWCSWVVVILGGGVPGWWCSWVVVILGGGVPGWWCSWVVVILGGGVPGWLCSWVVVFLGGVPFHKVTRKWAFLPAKMVLAKKQIHMHFVPSKDKGRFGGVFTNLTRIQNDFNLGIGLCQHQSNSRLQQCIPNPRNNSGLKVMAT